MAKRRTERGDSRSRGRKKQTKAQAHATKQFYALIVMLFLILVFVVGAGILLFSGGDTDKPPSTENNLFAVETISVEGNTKYMEEAVIGESGVLIGQSIFSVKGNDIKEHLLETFPYYATVEVQTLHMNEVRITVTETDVVGVMYAKGHWIPIGANGKVLDKQEITSDRPRNALYIKATLPDKELEIGDVALEEYNASVLQTILSAIDQYALTDIIEVDLTDLTDIRMNWRGQIEILLGNTTNLEHEIKVVATTIPKLLEMRGQQVSGVLNLTSYSNEALENQAVFSPASSLTTSTTASRQPAAGETTTTTAPPDDSSEEEIWYDDSSEDDTWYDDSSNDDSDEDDIWYDDSSDDDSGEDDSWSDDTSDDDLSDDESTEE